MERSLATGCAYWPSALSAAVPRGTGRSRRPGSPDPPLHVPLQAGRGMSGHVAEMDENAQLSAGHACGSRHYTTGCTRPAASME